MKKLLAMLMCLFLMAVPFAALAESAVDYSVHETFTAWLYATPNDYYQSYSDNPVIRYLNNLFNVTFEYEQPAAGTEQDSLSLMFGTGEYTDMIDMSYYYGSIAGLYEDGVIIDIAEYLDYMPNLKALIENNETFRKACYTDDGKILLLKQMMAEEEMVWGGLVYRRDILDTMTGGYVSFPSGNDEPTTIEDWDYMLPLFKAYFEAAGMADSAPLILPYNGYFAMGQMASGFGVNTSYYLEGDTVKYGPIEEGFYNYLAKMHEWYAAGYIYQDFASRVNDLFYLPNPALTYGAAAGAWFGLSSQVGDKMSMPEYGLIFDVHAAVSPVDTAHGVTAAYPFGASDAQDMAGGVAITTRCKNIPKLLSVLDFMYGEKGSMFRIYGLTTEDGAADDPSYQLAGLTDGAYWFEGDTLVRNPIMMDGSVDGDAMISSRLPALGNTTYANLEATPEEKQANEAWRAYGDTTDVTKLPLSLSRPVDEDKAFTTNNTRINDYINERVPKFIMGTIALNEATWNEFVAQIKAYGIEENLSIQQAAYDRYLER